MKVWSFLRDTFSSRRRAKPTIAGLAHWSVPDRRIADRSLPPIPYDIYLAIFDHIQQCEDGDEQNYRSHLANLSLVCRLFNAVFVPRLFDSIRIFQDLGKGKEGRGLSFYKALLNDREPVRSLRLYVRTCSFGFMDTKLSQRPAQAIARLVNLRSLSLSNLVLTTTLFEAASVLSHLTSLSITHSQLAPDIDIPRDAAVQLKTFIFINTYPTPEFAESLARFIDSSSLRVLSTSCVDFLRAFINQPVKSSLEELTFPLTVEIVPDLVGFLNRTSSITTLSFPVYSGHKPTEFQGLLPSSLPRLQSLHCPSCLVAVFVPGRPVKRIDLNAPTYAGTNLEETSLGDRVRLFSILQRSTAAIEMLHVPVDTYFVASFGDHFPRLRTLYLECPAQRKQSDFTQTIDTLCQRWTETPPLIELRIKSRHCWSSWMFNLEMQHHLIESSVAVAFPTVRQVVFTESVEWRKDRHHWRPVIPRVARLMLKSRLQLSSFPFVKDYNGCLASLFQPGELNNGMRQILGLPLHSSQCISF